MSSIFATASYHLQKGALVDNIKVMFGSDLAVESHDSGFPLDEAMMRSFLQREVDRKDGYVKSFSCT